MISIVDIFNDIRAFVDAGGPVIRILLVVAFIMWILILERVLFYLFDMRKLLDQVMENWKQRQEYESWYALKIRQQYLAETRRAIRGPIPTIKTIIALCPLLGLLGTVTGMIQVFEVMAVLGTGNAREMASGVSAATLPTMAGMVLALSGMYPLAKFENIVNQESRRLRDRMMLIRGD
jgi:biopolymer transport protein ExbB